MSGVTQPLTIEDDEPLSPWWIRAVLIVMALGFAGLITITILAYRNAPPIPVRVVDAQGVEAIQRRRCPRRPEGISQVWSDGQRQHLGSWRPIWAGLLGRGAASHGGGHRRGNRTTAIPAASTPRCQLSQQAAVHAESAVELKTNRYDAATGDAAFDDRRKRRPIAQQIGLLDRLLSPSSRNGGLKADLIRDPAELAPAHRLRQLDRVGRRWPIVPARTIPIPTISHTIRRSAISRQRRAAVERPEPDRAAGRHCDRAAGLRQIRLSRLGHARTITCIRT